mmetsp:Transcript_85770/g.276824  ORF Transcript_85770/g.276824 Transcript_85770/m.276824 type:complete len:231 (-) Transcript_85770:811-1503(-)
MYKWLNGATLGVLYTPEVNANMKCAKMHGKSALKDCSRTRPVVLEVGKSDKVIMKSYTLKTPVRTYTMMKIALGNESVFSSSTGPSSSLTTIGLPDGPPSSFSTARKVRPYCSSFHITIITPEPNVKTTEPMAYVSVASNTIPGKYAKVEPAKKPKPPIVLKHAPTQAWLMWQELNTWFSMHSNKPPKVKKREPNQNEPLPIISAASSLRILRGVKSATNAKPMTKTPTR